MRTATVVLAVLLVVAGCNTAAPLGPTDTSTPTVTPVDVPADYAYAPGVTEEGVTDPAVLAAAHEAVLAETSHRITANRTVRYANGTLREQLLVDVRLDDDRTYLASATTRGPAAPVFLGRPPANGTYWSNGTTYVRALTRDGTTTYNEFGAPGSGAGTWRYWTRTVPFGGEQATPGRFYTDLFTSVPVEVVGRSQPNDTATRELPSYRLVGERVSENRFAEEFSAVRDVRLVATVRADGLVRSVSLRYVAEIDDATVEVVRTIRYRGVGTTTAERPAWFETAVEG